MSERVVTVKLRAEVAGFKQAMRDARSETQKTAHQFDKDGKQIETTSGRLVRSAELNRQAWTATGTAMVAFGAAGLLAITKSAQAAIQWETAWTGVLKTVDGTADQMSKLQGQLREMTRTLPVTHEQVAAVAEAAGQLGVQTDNIAEFTRVMVDLGNTTNLTSDEAATSIAQLMNVMQTAPDDVDNLASALVDLGNHGASTERDIILMAQRIGGAGKIIGLTEAQVLGLANALASVGIDAEAGGSAISNIMMDMAKSVNTGSKSLTTWARIAGQSSEEFSKAFKSDPAEALSDVVEGLGRMNKAGEDVFSTLDSLGQSDVRVTRALLSMATSGDLLRKSLADGTKAWQDNTALVAEAEKRYDTTAAKAEIARNSLNDAAITIGEKLLPVIASLAEHVADLANWFSSLPQPVQDTVIVLGGLASVAALVGGAFLILVPRVVAANEAMVKLGVSAPKAATGLSAVGKAAGPIAIALAAMAAGGAIEKWSVNISQGAGVATQAMLDLAAGADLAKTSLSGNFDQGGFKAWFTGNDLKDAADAFNTLANPSVTQGIDNVASSILTLGQSTSSSRMQSQEFFKTVDQGLASLVQSGDKADAAKAFDAVTEATGASRKELRKFLPEYVDALAAADSQQQVAATSTKALTGETEELTEAEKEAAQALQDWRDMVSGADSSFINLSDAYDAAIQKNKDWAQSVADSTKSSKDSMDTYYNGTKVTISQYKKQLQDQVKAQAAWEKSITKLAKRANSSKLSPEQQATANAMLNDLISQGPAGAAEAKLLAGASFTDFKKIVNLYSQTGKEATDAFTEKIEQIQNPVVTPTIDPDPALQQYHDFLKKLYTMPAPTVTPKGSGGGGGGGGVPRRYSTGGGVWGEGTPTSDSIAAWLSDGEHVLTAREVRGLGGHSVVEQIRAFARGNAYASGGIVGSPHGVSSPQVVTVPVSSTHTAAAPVAIQNAYFNSPGDAGMAALERLNRKSGG